MKKSNQIMKKSGAIDLSSRLSASDNDLRIFALMCAKAVLPVFEAAHTNDIRVRECIDTTEKYLNGDGNTDDLKRVRKSTFIIGVHMASDAAMAAAWAARTAYIGCTFPVLESATKTIGYALLAADGNQAAAIALLEVVKKFYKKQHHRLLN